MTNRERLSALRLQVARLYIAIRTPVEGYVYISGRATRDLATDVLKPVIGDLTRVIAFGYDDDEDVISTYDNVKDIVDFVRKLMWEDKKITERVDSILRIIDIYTKEGDEKENGE